MSEAEAPPPHDGWGHIPLKDGISQWNSRKLFVVLLNIVVVGVVEVFGDMSWTVCIALTVPTALYLGGQSIVDAAEKFGIAYVQARKP